MGVDHRRLDVAVPEEFLNRPDSGRVAADQGGHGDLSGGKFPGDDGRHGGAEGSAKAIGRPPVVRGTSGIV